MYRAHFGLIQLPFKNAPDEHFFYGQASRREILNALIYVVRRGDAIVKVTGEVGCGKTTLLRLLADSLMTDFKVVYINSPNLAPKDLLFHIAEELGLSPDLGLPKYALLKVLREQLLQFHAKGKQVVMLVDEAQAMSTDTLEEIRLLSNIETSTDKLLQIVLFGQPELDTALQQHNLRQLKDRISYHIHVPPLSPEEVQSYLNYRMRQASYKELDFFNPYFSRWIHKLSSGLPRSINTIADQLLMAVYGSGDRQLKKKHFGNISSENVKSVRRGVPVILAGVLVLLVAASFMMYRFDYVITDYLSPASKVPVQGPLQSEEQLVADALEMEEQVLVAEQVASKPLETAVLADKPQAVDVTEAFVETVDSQGGQGTDRLLSLLQQEAVLPEEELRTLVALHQSAEDWVSEHTPSSYLIQLSVSPVADFSKALCLLSALQNVSGEFACYGRPEAGCEKIPSEIFVPPVRKLFAFGGKLIHLA
jgi:type II secretory pathway predicted ATPase ExeA